MSQKMSLHWRQGTTRAFLSQNFYLLVSLIGSKINLDYEDHKMAPISLKDKLYTSLESAHRDLRIHLIRYPLF